MWIEAVTAMDSQRAVDDLSRITVENKKMKKLCLLSLALVFPLMLGTQASAHMQGGLSNAEKAKLRAELDATAASLSALTQKTTKSSQSRRISMYYGTANDKCEVSQFVESEGNPSAGWHYMIKLSEVVTVNAKPSAARGQKDVVAECAPGQGCALAKKYQQPRQFRQNFRVPLLEEDASRGLSLMRGLVSKCHRYMGKTWTDPSAGRA